MNEEIEQIIDEYNVFKNSNQELEKKIKLKKSALKEANERCATYTTRLKSQEDQNCALKAELEVLRVEKKRLEDEAKEMKSNAEKSDKYIEAIKEELEKSNKVLKTVINLN